MVWDDGTKSQIRDVQKRVGSEVGEEWREVSGGQVYYRTEREILGIVQDLVAARAGTGR